MKKAQSMGLNLVIVAVIALIVLIVIVVIFTGKSKQFSQGTSDTAKDFTGDNCEIPGTGQTCRSYVDCSNQGGTTVNGECESGQVCCTV